MGSSRNLVEETTRRIADDIAAGRMPPGTRLPTEQAMVDAMGVSRTVIREAVAALRAEGLVATRQGIGSFVVEQPSRLLFRIDADQAGSLSDALHIMELRTAVETEAAGLAAERATKAQLEAIHSALAAIEAAIHRGEPAITEDFSLHAAITDATGNPQFRRFLEFLGRSTIPRTSIRAHVADMRSYLLEVQREHEAIVEAIDARSVQRAQAAMRAHLVKSSRNYQALARARQQKAAPQEPA